MNATTDNLTAAELERKGEQIRANLDRTLDDIQRKFSSGELVDRSVDFIRENGSDVLREVGDTVRRNPAPVLLTAAGLIWLASSVVRSRSGRDEYLDAEYQEEANGWWVRSIRDRTDDVRWRMGNLVKEQPVAMGALALVAGALIGAVLPMTDYENKHVGPVHDRAFERAKQAGRREYDNLRQALASSLDRKSRESRRAM